MNSSSQEAPAARVRRRTTRASFLKAGAGGLLTVSAGGALSRQLDSSARAASDAVVIDLVINEGYVRMTDGSAAFMRGFGISRDGSPMVPGPAIGGNAAAVMPGEVAFVKAGDPVLLRVRNGLTGKHANEEHFFTIDGAVDRYGVPLVEAVPIDPSGKVTYIPFNAPEQAGTYFYLDDDPIQRMLGLHGVMVVMPADDTRRPYVPTKGLLEPPYFDEQFVWVFHDIDPVWGEQARNGVFRPGAPPPIDEQTCLPRYFTINGVSGKQSDESLFNSMRRFVVPEGVRGQGTLIRIVNAGAATHSPHFHGNHVYVLTQNRQLPEVGGLPALSSLGEEGVPVSIEKDVVRMQSLGCTDVLLPFHEPLDQWPPYSRPDSHDFRYPMHCHAEMSQSAGGGQYPSGMYTEWHLKGDLGEAPHVGG
jgi:FtsP/CotA-like multicopper oxidase with cupredoxin domain